MAIGRHFKTAFDSLYRAKETATNLYHEAIHFELTQTEVLDRESRMLNSDWFKALPRWAQSEYRGFRQAVLGDRLWENTRTVHLYQCKLYRDYTEWRDAVPESVPSTELTDSCVTVYKKRFDEKGEGKIYFAGLTEEKKALEGTVFPRYKSSTDEA